MVRAAGIQLAFAIASIPTGLVHTASARLSVSDIDASSIHCTSAHREGLGEPKPRRMMSDGGSA